MNKQLTSVDKMVDDAIDYLDSLSVDELEEEFKSHGITVRGKKHLVENDELNNTLDKINASRVLQRGRNEAVQT